MSPVGWTGALAALVAALVLTTLPLPESLAIGRPAIVPLVLMYLCISTPRRFGMLWGFGLGLVLDVTHSTALGQHALALGLLCYLGLKLRDTVQLFPIWQQTVVLAPVWAAYQGLLLWLDGYVGQSIEPAWRWLPAASTALMWPLICGYFALIDRPQHHTA